MIPCKTKTEHAEIFIAFFPALAFVSASAHIVGTRREKRLVSHEQIVNDGITHHLLPTCPALDCTENAVLFGADVDRQRISGSIRTTLYSVNGIGVRVLVATAN